MEADAADAGDGEAARNVGGERRGATPPRAAEGEGALVRVIEEARPCLSCGYDLRGQEVRREPHYGWVILRCPECGFVAPLGTQAQSRWLWRSGAVLLAAGWFAVVIAVIAVAGGGLAWCGWNLAWRSAEAGHREQSALWSVLAQRDQELQRLQNERTQAAALRAQLALGAGDPVETQRRIAHIEQRIDAFAVSPMVSTKGWPAHALSPGHETTAAAWRLAWVELQWAVVVAVPTALVLTIMMPGVRGVRLMALAVAVTAVGLVAIHAVGEGLVPRFGLSPGGGAGWWIRWRHSQMLAMYQAGGVLTPAAQSATTFEDVMRPLTMGLVVACGVVLAATLRVMRPAVRMVVRWFTPRWIRSQLAELWTADGLEVPGLGAKRS